MTALPDGRLGQGLAVMLLVLVLTAAWVAAAAPLLDWYGIRAETIGTRRILAQRMDRIAATLPGLQQQAKSTEAVIVPVLDGGTDAVAGAQLQQRVQVMAADVGATLSSAEVLPAELAGAYRRIGLRVSVSAPWPVLIRLMQSIASGGPGAPGSTPGFTIDDLQLHGGRGYLRDKATPLEATLIVLAFRPGVTP